MANHSPVDMGRRFIKCACTAVFRVSEDEGAGLSQAVINNILLDLILLHISAMKERGR